MPETFEQRPETRLEHIKWLIRLTGNDGSFASLEGRWLLERLEECAAALGKVQAAHYCEVTERGKGPCFVCDTTRAALAALAKLEEA